MNYESAHNFIYNDIGEESNQILMCIAEDKIQEGITLIKELTLCDEMVAKALWTDLKCDFGSSDTNPYIDSKETKQKYTTQIPFNIPHCPTCNSTNIKRISTTAKVTNIAMFGLLGNKRKKTFYCNNCRYEW